MSRSSIHSLANGRRLLALSACIIPHSDHDYTYSTSRHFSDAAATRFVFRELYIVSRTVIKRRRPNMESRTVRITDSSERKSDVHFRSKVIANSTTQPSTEPTPRSMKRSLRFPLVITKHSKCRHSRFIILLQDLLLFFLFESSYCVTLFRSRHRIDSTPPPSAKKATVLSTELGSSLLDQYASGLCLF